MKADDGFDNLRKELSRRQAKYVTEIIEDRDIPDWHMMYKLFDEIFICRALIQELQQAVVELRSSNKES